jgi:hypothetical protein
MFSHCMNTTIPETLLLEIQNSFSDTTLQFKNVSREYKLEENRAQWRVYPGRKQGTKKTFQYFVFIVTRQQLCSIIENTGYL